MGQDLAVRIVALVDALPRSRSSDLIVTQLVRSAGSVPANIAEGYGRFSKAAYRNHLSIARGSLFETQSWLDLLTRMKLIKPGVAVEIDGQCEELARILSARMRALESKNGAIREVGPIYQVEHEDLGMKMNSKPVICSLLPVRRRA
jgi:four helix bundle protein